MMKTLDPLTVWSGKPLDGSSLFIVPLSEAVAGPRTADQPLIAATAALDAGVIVSRRRLTQFIEGHADRMLVCHDAGRLHWLLHDCLGEEGGSNIGTLWRYSRENRIFDVAAVDQRLWWILSGTYRLPRSISELGREWGVLQGTSEAEPARQLAILVRVFEILGPRVDQLSRSMPKRLVSRFGRLGIGLDVQGAIASAHAARTGLILDRQAADEAEFFEDIYSVSSGVLWGDKTARRCFRWTGGVVRRNQKDFPDEDRDRLRDWLEQQWQSCVDLRGAIVKPPLDQAGALSTVPAHWGILTRYNRRLRAWADLHAAADVLRLLRRGEPVRPIYGDVPRILTRRPDLGRVRLFGRNLFAPKEGHRFLVGRMRHLELRCYAIVCGVEFPGGGSRVYDLFGRREDPVATAEAHLTELNAARESGSTWFGRLNQADRLAATDLLLYAIPRGCSVSQITALLHEEPRLTGAGQAEVDRLLRHVVFEVFPELELFVEDSTPEAIADRLGISLRELRERLGPDDLDESIVWPFALRNVLSGRTRGNKVRRELAEICRDDAVRDVLQEHDPGSAYDKLLTVRSVTPTGRVTRPVYCTEERSAMYLELADDVRRRVLYELVAAGFKLVAVTGDEFVLETEDPRSLAADVARLAESAAESLLSDAAWGCCECRTCLRW